MIASTQQSILNARNGSRTSAFRFGSHGRSWRVVPVRLGWEEPLQTLDASASGYADYPEIGRPKWGRERTGRFPMPTASKETLTPPFTSATPRSKRSLGSYAQLLDRDHGTRARAPLQFARDRSGRFLQYIQVFTSTITYRDKL